MSMLSLQADELRTMADKLRGVRFDGANYIENVETLYMSMGAMREAADTIESLRDRLRPVPAELDYIEDKSKWFELFGTPERAARTIAHMCDGMDRCECCPCFNQGICPDVDDCDALLEWLRGDAE